VRRTASDEWRGVTLTLLKQDHGKTSPWSAIIGLIMDSRSNDDADEEAFSKALDEMRAHVSE